LTETLASEAEQGYDLSKAKRCRVKESAPRAQDSIGAKLDAAPYDDEGLTDGDLRAIKEARSESGISWFDAEQNRSPADQVDGRSRFGPSDRARRLGGDSRRSKLATGDDSH